MKMLGALLVSVSLAISVPGQAAWQDSPEVKQLYEKAKAEGRVMIWGTQQGEVNWIPKAFNAIFPGIEVQWIGDNDIATKAIAEARAGRHQIDVFWHSLTGVAPLMQRDLLAKVDWSPFGVTGATIAYNGRAAFTNNMAYVVAYNSALANKAELPERWDEMAASKFKGKTTASLFLLPRLSGGLTIPWGKDKTVEFVRGLVGNDILLTRSPREPIINSGERIYSVGEVDSLVRRWGRSGLKIEYVVPEPIILGQFVATVMEKAPSPNAARLLAGFLTTPDGKKAREQATSAADYSAAGTSDFAKLVNSGKVQVVPDTPELMAQREKAIAEMGPIVAGQR